MKGQVMTAVRKECGPVNLPMGGEPSPDAGVPRERCRGVRSGKSGRDKLASDSGETLVECLISVLIISLSVSLLLVIVSDAVALDQLALDKDNTLSMELEGAEMKTECAGSAVVTISGSGLEDICFSVRRYGGSSIVSYK